MKGEKPKGPSSKSDLSNLTCYQGQTQCHRIFISHSAHLIPGMKQVGVLCLQVAQLLAGRKTRDGGRGRVSALVKGDVSGEMTKGNAEHETRYDRQHRNRVHGDQPSSNSERLLDLQGDHFLRPCLSCTEGSAEVDPDSSKQMKSLGI